MNRHDHSIGTRTVRGMAWAYGSFVGGRLLSLVATAILARVLVPEVFGLVALALTLMALLDGIADLGLSKALVIQKDDVVERRADTVFITTVALGVLASIVIAAAGPLAATFFSEPDLTGIAVVLGLNFLIRSFGSTHYAFAQRSLDFRTRTAAEFAEVFIRGGVGIVLALAGFGAWSLVIGYLSGTFSLVCVLWAMVSWRPRLRASGSDLRQMLRFGTTLSGVDIVAAVISNIDYLFIGRVLGATSLGLYTLGFRLPELLVINLSVVAAEVLFPAFSAIDRSALTRAFLIAMRYILLLAAPATVTLIVLAEPIVVGLFGDQWHGSVLPMQILALYAFSVALDIPAGTAYKATGRAGVLLLLGIVRLVTLAGALLVFTDQGIGAVAAAQAVTGIAVSLAATVLASRLLMVRTYDILQAAAPALGGSILMVIPMLLVEQLIGGVWIPLIAGGVLGLGTYIGFLMLVAPGTLRFITQKMFPSSLEPPDDLMATRETDVIA